MRPCTMSVSDCRVTRRSNREAYGNRKLESGECANKGRIAMITILVVIVGALFLGLLPIWPYSGSWGYLPSYGLGFLFLVLSMLALTGRTKRSVADTL